MTIASGSSSFVAHRRRSMTFFISSEKKDSMAALSPYAPIRPIDPVSPFDFRVRTKTFDRK